MCKTKETSYLNREASNPNHIIKTSVFSCLNQCKRQVSESLPCRMHRTKNCSDKDSSNSIQETLSKPNCLRVRNEIGSQRNSIQIYGHRLQIMMETIINLALGRLRHKMTTIRLIKIRETSQVSLKDLLIRTNPQKQARHRSSKLHTCHKWEGNTTKQVRAMI